MSKKVLFRGGPLDGQVREIEDCRSVTVPSRNRGGRWSYEPSGHVVNGLPEWVAAGLPPDIEAKRASD